jgi:hypothetical protein
MEKTMFYTVYQITNLVNNKVYVGKHQTTDLDDGYMGSGKLLGAAKQKYGIANFKKEVIHIFETEEEMNLAERNIVTEEFCSRHDTYNLCRGGTGGFGYINSNKMRNGFEKTLNIESVKKATLESADRGRETQRKLWKENGEWASKRRAEISRTSRESAAINGGAFKDKTHSEDTKKKIGAANSINQSGSKNSQFGKMWITNGTENKKIKNDAAIPNGWKKGRVCK